MRDEMDEANFVRYLSDNPKILQKQLEKIIAEEKRKAQYRRDNPIMTYGIKNIHDVTHAVVRFGLCGCSLLPDDEMVEAAVRDGTIFQKFVNNIHYNNAEGKFGALLFDLFKIYEPAMRLRAGKEPMRPKRKGKKTPARSQNELVCPAKALVKPREIFDLDDDISSEGSKNATSFVVADRVRTVEAARRSIASATGKSMRSVIRETRGWSVEEILALLPELWPEIPF